MAGRARSRAAGALAVVLPAVAAASLVLTLGEGDAGAPEGPRGRYSTASLARAAAVQGGPPAPLPLYALRPPPPRSISIPAAGVEAPVEPVEAVDGVVRVPAVGHAGWFQDGPRPGEVGRSVIIGHLDGRNGPGLFARVPRLTPGTTVTVTDRSGSEHHYRIVGATRVDKTRFPARYVYGGATAPVLVLVTCGGPFTEGRGYRDNVLVYARGA